MSFENGKSTAYLRFVIDEAQKARKILGTKECFTKQL